MINVINKLMKKIFYFTLFIIFLYTVLPHSVYADIFSLQIFYNSSINKFELKNKNESLLKDGEIYPELFQKLIDTKGKFNIIFYEKDGTVIVSIGFNPVEGLNKIELPYLSLSSYCKIIDNANKKEMLRIDLSKYVKCNRNSICEYERGEDVTTCMPDCVRKDVQYSDETLQTLKANGEKIINNGTVVLYNINKQNSTFPKYLYLFIGITFIVTLLILFRKIKNKS